MKYLLIAICFLAVGIWVGQSRVSANGAPKIQMVDCFSSEEFPKQQPRLAMAAASGRPEFKDKMWMVETGIGQHCVIMTTDKFAADSIAVEARAIK